MAGVGATMKTMIFVALSFLFFSSSALARNCTKAEKADGDRWGMVEQAGP